MSMLQRRRAGQQETADETLDRKIAEVQRDREIEEQERSRRISASTRARSVPRQLEAGIRRLELGPPAEPGRRDEHEARDQGTQAGRPVLQGGGGQMGQQSDVRQQVMMRDATAMRPVAAGQFLWGAVQGAAGAVGAAGTQLQALGGATLQLETETTINYLKGILMYYTVQRLPAEPCRGKDPGGAERDGRRPIIVVGRTVVCWDRFWSLCRSR